MIVIRKQLRAKKKIERDKQIKQNKLLEDFKNYSYDKMCSFANFVKSLPKCMDDVVWKRSVQCYYLNCISNMIGAYLNVKDRKLIKPISCREVVIYERGKKRIITPIHIYDRMVQKVLCDNALVPVFTRKLIYDNGASLKGKGVMFSRKRLLKHLRKAVKKFGADFYILSFDFKSYFDSIPHKTCRIMLREYFLDEDIVTLTMHIIKSPYRAKIMKIKDAKERAIQLKKLDNDELCGICLGSQVSQIMALVVANRIDHYIKDTKRFKFYDRYMDDGRVIAKTKEELEDLLKDMEKICDDLGLTLSPKKTFITKASKGFTFLKVRYYVTQTGKIVKKLTHAGIVRMRKKLKKFRRKVDAGLMTLDDVYASMQSWLAHAKVADSYKTVKSMLKLYDELFNGYRIKNKKETKRVLQANKREKYNWSYYQRKLQKATKTA